MGGQAYGALGATFVMTRVLQGVSMIAIIGMTANFISNIVSANNTPPNVLIGILSVVCIAVLYCAITVVLFMDSILPFLIATVIDSLFLIAVIVVSVIVGKPLSFLNCKVLGDMSDTASSAYSFTSALAGNLGQSGVKIDFSQWIGTDQSTCYEMKSIWGLSIALCILFAFSTICGVCLWRRSSMVPAKGDA